MTHADLRARFDGYWIQGSGNFAVVCSSASRITLYSKSTPHAVEIAIGTSRPIWDSGSKRPRLQSLAVRSCGWFAMPEPETELDRLRRAARKWAGWEPIEAIEAEEKQVQESAGSPGDGEKQ